MGDGVVIKRGRMEIKVAGDDAAKVVSIVLNAARNGDRQGHTVSLFPAPEQPAIASRVDHLIGRRILTVGDDTPLPAAESPLDIFYWHFGTQTKDISRRMSSKRIRILGVNEISRRLVAGLYASGATSFEVYDVPLLRNESLFNSGGGFRDDVWLGTPVKLRPFANDLHPDTMDCVVATSDSGGVEQLRAWNEFCVLHNLQFFPVLLQDLVGYVGPMVVPGETA